MPRNRRWKTNRQYYNWWQRNNPEKIRAYRCRYYHRLKAQMIAEYGGGCACCGETEPEFLTIEHVLRDGAQERRELSTTTRIMQKMKRLGWPKDRYSVLCYNCNLSTKDGRVCVHKRQRERTSLFAI